MFDLYMYSPSGEFGAYVGSFGTEDEALEFMGENERSGEDWEIRYTGKHECRNRRCHNHVLNYNAEMSPVAPHAEYMGKHEKITELFEEVAEIFAEVCNDLAITAEFISETVAEHTANMRTIVQKYLHKLWLPMPEFRPARNLFPTGMEVMPYAGIVGA